MAGSRRSGLLLQDRDRNLLQELVVMRVVDRQEAQVVVGFRSITRANTRLLALTRAGLLNRFFIGTDNGGKKSLYALSEKGAALIGAAMTALKRKQDSVLIGDRFVEHQSRINQIYIATKFLPIPVENSSFARWVSFARPLTSTAAIIPDGYFELQTNERTVCTFLEVDLGTEAQKLWRKKIEGYLRYALSGDFERQFQHSQFRVLVITTTERKADGLRRLTAKYTQKIFWFSSFDLLNTNDFWSAIWFRPSGPAPQTFLGGVR